MADVADLDQAVAAFESAWSEGPPDLAAFVRDRCDLPLLVELVRVDLEFRRRNGLPARLAPYLADYPELAADRMSVGQLAYEEYRQRAAIGEPVTPREYAARYGIDTSAWPVSRGRQPATTDVLSSGGQSGKSPTTFPELGETLAGFRLLSDLGSGAFGRVYLAEQIGLSGRRVAVKLTTRFGANEPETLARLQHTHIVPVYSTHRAGPFQIVVMPYLGAVTLVDLLRDLHSRTGWPASGKELAETLALRRSATAPGSGSPTDVAPTSAPHVRADLALRTLSRFSYPNAVLWIGARLADALAHAHDRGILHRDVKPANVLLTDDGVPMLLDFNLATDAAEGRSPAGGTPAYMAPEQLRALRGEHVAIDGRADLYALGIVLFELLTGQHPYPWPAKGQGNSADLLLPLRAASPPSLRAIQPSVSPSTEAIIHRCLHPDPLRRYQSARELAEDLDRQLSDQPLRHTREPSYRERFGKWRRRHPQLTSSGSVAALAAVAVVALGGLVLARTDRVNRLEAEQAEAGRRVNATDRYQAFRAEAAEAIRLLAVYGHDPRKAEEGERRTRAALAAYGVLEDAEWVERSAVVLLPESERPVLRSQVAELLTLLARVAADRANELPPGPDRDAGLNASLALLDRAAASYAAGSVPLATATERAEVQARLGRTTPDDTLKVAPAAARESYLAGTAALARGRYNDAVRALEQATDRDPRRFWAWFGLGVAHLGLGRDAQAEGCFHACIALEPDHPMAHFNRGLSRLNRRLFPAAESDFTTALRLQPDLADALVNRALARAGQGKDRDAEADYTRALGLRSAEVRIYFLRAEVRERRGDKAGAAADRAAGFATTPADEASWVARGMARATTDPTAAIADFDAALKLNPRSFPALQNKAFVLTDKLNRAADAVAVLGVALEHFPDAHLARAGRAVLLARTGDRTAAHADAEACLNQGPTADIVYQLAGVYALTSKKEPADARIALRLLSDALRQGYGAELLAVDNDLDPIRDLAEFRALVAPAKLPSDGAGKESRKM